MKKRTTYRYRPGKQGLYNPKNEHDACGIGFVANIKGNKNHSIVQNGLEMLENLEHRGAVSSDGISAPLTIPLNIGGALPSESENTPGFSFVFVVFSLALVTISRSKRA